MHNIKKPYRLLALILAFVLLCFSFLGCEDITPSEESTTREHISEESTVSGESAEENVSKSSTHLDQNGSYTSKEDVANYLIEYGRLPSNFIRKKEAKELGWPGGDLEPYAPGKCIGGDRFHNYEGTLPDNPGVTYYECDIDTLGAKKRGAKRIIYSDDGHIYYTDDHYKTFTLLYEEANQ